MYCFSFYVCVCDSFLVNVYAWCYIRIYFILLYVVTIHKLFLNDLTVLSLIDLSWCPCWKASYVWVCFWTLGSTLLICIFILMAEPIVLILYLCSKFCSQECDFSNILLFSRLFWLFYLPCISIWILRSICRFLEKSHLRFW